MAKKRQKKYLKNVKIRHNQKPKTVFIFAIQKALLLFGDDPRYSQHLACWSNIFQITPDDIIADFLELRSLIDISFVIRNRSKNEILYTELQDGEIINGQQGKRFILTNRMNRQKIF